MKKNKNNQKGKQKYYSDHQTDDSQESDPLEELTRPQLLQINYIFNSLSENKNKLIEQTHQTNINVDDGGFICEKEKEEEGGFILDDKPTTEKSSTTDQDEIQQNNLNQISNRMNIENIPNALKLLGLAYKDSEILKIFENAASSDIEDENNQKIKMKKQKSINKIKFSKVVAVLMIGNSNNDNNNNSKKTNNNLKRNEDDSEFNFDQPFKSDQESLTCNYQPNQLSNKKSNDTKRRRKTRQSRNSTEFDFEHLNQTMLKGNKKNYTKTNQKSGKKVQEEDRFEEENKTNINKNLISDTFSLFFDSKNLLDSNLKLSHQTIGHQEIRLAANKLGENLTDEQIQEMLNYASCTNDSRVTLNAFEKIIKEIRAV